MRTRTLLGAALAASVSGALALSAQVPSSTAATATTTPTSAHVSDKQSATRAAADYVADHRSAFKAGRHDSLSQVSTTAGTADTQYVAYTRSYRGLPVIGGDFVVAVDRSGKVTGTSATQRQVVDLASVTPKVSASAARRTARAQVARVTRTSTPQLIVHAQRAPRLAWSTRVDGLTAQHHPTKLTVYTDAVTGKVLGSWDLVSEGSGTGYYYPGVTIGTSLSGSTYRMNDTARPGVSCANQSGTIFSGPDDVWGNGSGTNLETACVDAQYATGKEVDMLSSWLGRNGVKGNGTTYPSRVGLNDVNAYYDGSIVNFGHSSDNTRQLTAIDIVAHEQGHGIFQTTPGASTGDGETGGMNESTGDIFGALTEAYAANPNDPADFTVGEEADLVGDGPIRYMYNPSLIGDPNCWSTSIKNTEVHAAAGPLNHWFYLLSQGSNASPASPTCNGSTVTGVGIQTAGRIFYNGLLLKTTYWTHGKARIATLTATNNLFGTTDCTTFNKVKAAWDAISVPAQSGEPTCGGGGGGGTCTEVTNTGSVSQGVSSYKPSSSGFAAAAGIINGCLTGPAGVDLDLYLQRWNGSSWVDVAASEGSTSTETIAYTAGAGTYRWDVYAYSGSGSFTMKYDIP